MLIPALSSFLMTLKCDGFDEVKRGHGGRKDFLDLMFVIFSSKITHFFLVAHDCHVVLGHSV